MHSSATTDRKLSCAEFAALNHVQATTVRNNICRFGHYFGVKPERLANGRLSFPNVQVKKGDEHDA